MSREQIAPNERSKPRATHSQVQQAGKMTLGSKLNQPNVSG